MRGVLVCAALLLATPAAAEDNLAEMRENLMRLSVAPAAFGGKTVRIFCPIEMADTDGIFCVVLNSSQVPVGREYIPVNLNDPAPYLDVLNKCPGPLGRSVQDHCTYAVDVHVDMSGGYGYPQAVALRPLFP